MNRSVLTVALNPSVDKTVTVDRLAPYGLNRVQQSEIDPGGKGINVARVLQSFGDDVTVTGFLSGHTGKFLFDCIQQDKIKTGFLEIPGETRTNIKIFDQTVKKTTEINEQGNYIAPEELELFQKKFLCLLPTVRVVVISGSLPPGVPLDFYAELTELAEKSGAKVILDADGEALQKGIDSRPFAVKPNIHELTALIGKPLKTEKDVLEAGRNLLEKGIRLVVVSLGADGAIALDPSGAFKADVWKITVKSATGAGDSMVGALADAVLCGMSLEEITRAATAAGTVTASKPGTQLCTGPEVKKALPLVTLHRIKF
ncbi:MAG: 1-phosphofructokinase [Oscillospiraceae bacterium]|jgi:1-phosphofructokinase|nr:1-phosphofructokinase [Oscillospiraceae bacterium]